MAVVLTGWYVGFAIAGTAIAVIVVLVAIILGLARRIGGQAITITEALDASRVHTLALWDVDVVNRSVGSIISGATRARSALGGN